jgi:hypothetical protein
MGTYDARRSRQSAVLLETSSFQPCLPPITCDINGTLMQKLSTGLEDPRLFRFKGQTFELLLI